MAARAQRMGLLAVWFSLGVPQLLDSLPSYTSICLRTYVFSICSSFGTKQNENCGICNQKRAPKERVFVGQLAHKQNFLGHGPTGKWPKPKTARATSGPHRPSETEGFNLKPPQPKTRCRFSSWQFFEQNGFPWLKKKKNFFSRGSTSYPKQKWVLGVRRIL